jgi:hypothetical protein
VAHKCESAETKCIYLNTELEKYKSGIKDFKDIVTLCEKEEKENKLSLSK